jgi:hypothetical protein
MKRYGTQTETLRPHFSVWRRAQQISFINVADRSASVGDAMTRFFSPLNLVCRRSLLLLITTCFMAHTCPAAPSTSTTTTTSARRTFNSSGGAGVAAALIKELGKRARHERVRPQRDIAVPEKLEKLFVPRPQPRGKIS